MKNVSSIKTKSKNESPKTPGGISKSLLTPCRRVGLSRNWKNKGPSPFISPLASNTSAKVEPVVLKKETRKRKSVVEPEENPTENVDPDTEAGESTPPNNTEEIVKTPLRNVELPRRKKSKTFLATLNSQISDPKPTDCPEIDDCTKENEASDDLVDKVVDIETPNTEKVGTDKEVSPEKEPAKPTKSKKFRSPLKPSTNTSSVSENDTTTENINETPNDVAELKKKKSDTKPKTRSPNQLTKECIVVIQKKLLKVKEKYNKSDKDVCDKPKKNSQPLFDSDDETPLSTINKNDNNKSEKPVIILDDDEDEFVENSSKTKNKIITRQNKKTAKTENKVSKPVKQTSKIIPLAESKAPSHSSFDDDDDDFFDKKKTILIRKTYDKIAKPNKAKSIGSVTQKDIDDIKARIEVKKKMLLARSMTSETEELRSLIKKWQKGCQDALVELMDLMKIKCPDKHGMDYSEILQMLKIPPALVGYDSDHDCFNTPDDTSAVLSKYNDF